MTDGSRDRAWHEDSRRRLTLDQLEGAVVAHIFHRGLLFGRFDPARAVVVPAIS